MKLSKTIIFTIFLLLTTSYVFVPVLLSGKISMLIYIPVLWLIGFSLGFIIVYLDRIVDIYYSNPDTELAHHVKKLFKQLRIIDGIKLINYNHKLQKKLLFRSALFHLTWALLTFFVITSNNTIFAKAFMLGLGLNILIDLVNEFFHTPKTYLKNFFWQINRDISDKDFVLYVNFSVVIYVIFLVWVLI